MGKQQNLSEDPNQPVIITPGSPDVLKIAHDDQDSSASTEPQEPSTEQNDASASPEPDPTLDQEPETDQNQQMQYQSGQLLPQEAKAQKQAEPEETISWSASEFSGHEKTTGWYLALSVIVVFVAGGIYLITKDIFSVVIVVIVAIALGMFAALKPRTMDYSVGPEGITVGQKHFSYTDFKSFSVFEEGSSQSLQLLPQKRFMMTLTVPFEEKDGDKIVGLIGEFLPFEHKQPDIFDRFSSKIHF